MVGNLCNQEAAMKIRHVILGAVAAIGLGLAAVSAQAAPPMAAGDLSVAARQASAVDQVYWTRRCWRYRGHLECRRYWVDYGYGPYYDDYYYRPAFGFFFGGPRFHHHHFRRW